MTRSAMRLALLSVLLSGCVGDVLCRGAGCRERGNGIELVERREVGEFSAVRADGSIDVDITVGSPASVEVRGDENIVPLVRTRVADRTLVIDTTRGHSTRIGLSVTITTPHLDAVALCGSGSIRAQGLETDRLDVAISGSGDVRLAGRADRLAIGISGSGDADAAALSATAVEVDIAGSGDADVVASERLDVDIAGSGSVRYAGDPAIHRSIAGSGDVARR